MRELRVLEHLGRQAYNIGRSGLDFAGWRGSDARGSDAGHGDDQRAGDDEKAVHSRNRSQEVRRCRSTGVQEPGARGQKSEVRIQKSEVDRKGSSHSATPELLQLLNSCFSQLLT